MSRGGGSTVSGDLPIYVAHNWLASAISKTAGHEETEIGTCGLSGEMVQIKCAVRLMKAGGLGTMRASKRRVSPIVTFPGGSTDWHDWLTGGAP